MIISINPRTFKSLAETNPEFVVNSFNSSVLNKLYSFMIREKKLPDEITHKDIEKIILNDDKLKGRLKIRAYKKIIEIYEYIINNCNIKNNEKMKLSKVIEDLYKYDIKEKVLKKVEYLTDDDIKKAVISAYEYSDLPGLYSIVLSLYWGIPVTRFFGSGFNLNYDIDKRMIIREFKNKVYIHPWCESMDIICKNFINLSKNIYNNGVKHINRFYQSKIRTIFENVLGYYLRSDVFQNTFFRNLNKNVPDWVITTYKKGITKKSRYYTWGLDVISNEYVNSMFDEDNYMVKILKELKIIGG